MTIENGSQRCTIVAAALSVSLLAGCATNLTDDERFAREYERAEMHGSIREFVYSCESAGHVVLYTGPSYHRLRDPVIHIPSNARLLDYACANQNAISREFGLGG